MFEKNHYRRSKDSEPMQSVDIWEENKKTDHPKGLDDQSLSDG